MRAAPDSKTTPGGPRGGTSRGGGGPLRRLASPLGLLAGCVVLAFVLHGSTLHHPFLSDDCVIIQNNPTLANGSPGVPFRLLGMDYWSQLDARGRVFHAAVDRNLYRPAASISFWLNARLAGMAPAGFRAVNILLHGVTAASAGLLAAAWLNPAAGVVAAAGVLFHPAATDVINRLVGRTDILVLLGLCLFLLIDCRAARRGWNTPLIVLAAVVGAMALGAKESGLVLLPVSLAQALLHGAGGGGGAGTAGNARAAGSARPATRSARARFIGPAIALGLTLVYLIARLNAVGTTPYAPGQGGDLTANPLQGIGLAGRLAPGISLAFYYARMLVWPWPLLAMDRPPALPTWNSPSAWLGMLVLAAVVVLALRAISRRREPLPAAGAFGLAWWLLSFAMVGQILSPIGTFREVRLCYPFLGTLAFGLAILGTRIGTGAASPGRRALRLLPLLPLLLPAVFATLTIIRNRDFTSESAMYQADMAANPRAALPRLIVGTLYWNAGRTPDAARVLEEAVRLAPSSAEARTNLGGLYIEMGDSARAETHLRRALDLDPRNASALMYLGFLRLQQGRPNEAWGFLLESERRDPENTWTQTYLAEIEASRGQFDSALRRLDRVAARSPGNAQLAGMRQGIEAMKRRLAQPGAR